MFTLIKATQINDFLNSVLPMTVANKNAVYITSCEHNRDYQRT